MAGVRDEDLPAFGPWTEGLDNRSPLTATPPNRLRAADNIDLDDAGLAHRRRGFVEVEALVGLHSIWAHPDYPDMLGVYDGDLIAFDASLTRTVRVATLVNPTLPVDYDLHAGRVAWTNGTDAGELDLDGDNRPWAVESPAGQPTLSASNVGGLTAGTYQVALTFLDGEGRESGSTLAELIDLTEGQGITLNAIPQPVHADVTHVRVYVTPTNGDILYEALTFAVGITTAIVAAHTPGRPLSTQFLIPLPPGQIVRHRNGRRFSARGKTVWFSEAMHPGLAEPVGNRIDHKHDLTLMEPIGEGAAAGWFIAAGERTYFVGVADPQAANWPRRIAYNHGAVRGSALQVSGEDFGAETADLAPCWLATNGQTVRGNPGGTVSALQNRYTALTGVSRATVARREYRGIRQLLWLLRGGSTAGTAISDGASATVTRNGVVVNE